MLGAPKLEESIVYAVYRKLANAEQPQTVPHALQVLPFFHMYRGANGKVAEFSASVSKIQRLRCGSKPGVLLVVAVTSKACRHGE